MSRTIWLAVPVLAILTLAATYPVEAAERRFTVGSFEKLRVEGPYAVTIATGRGSSALATGDRRALDRLSVELQGTTQIVRPDRSGWGGWPGEAGGAAAISLSTPALQSIAIDGSGAVRVNRMAGPRIDLSLSGAGEVAVGEIATDLLALTIQGAGKATLAGKAATARIASLGAGEVAAAALVTENADVTAAGSGNVQLAATRSARVKASGSGNVAVTGKAACTVSNQGSGRVSCGSGKPGE